MNTAFAPAQTDHDPFAGPPLAAFAPVTGSQREVWLACKLDPDLNIGYNEGLDLRLEGALDVEVLRASLQTLVGRHQSLRTTFSPDGNWLCVLEELALDVPLVDVAGDRALAGLSERLMRTPFDLECGPLASFTLVRRDERRYNLLFVAHHIIVDGWSAAVLLTELGELYSAGVEKREPKLGTPPRYTDYATIELAFLESGEGQLQERYWLDCLHNPPPTLDLPSTRARPAQRRFEANRIDHKFPAELVARLRSSAAAQGASLVAMMLAALSTLLNRLTGSEDMIIGLAAAGQSLHLQTDLVGHCVNLLPLRLQPHADLAFSEFLKQTRTVVLDASDHQGITFGSLIPKLNIPRDDSRPPLVSVVFNIDVRDDNISHTGLAVSYKTMVRRAETFELFINVVDDGRDLLVECSYSEALFDAHTIKRRLSELETLLGSACANPEARIGELVFVPPAERDRLLREYNRTQVERCARGTNEIIAEQCARNPERVALCAGGVRLRYVELKSRADVLSAALHAAGARPGGVVAVALDRTWQMPVATFAIHQCGCAYLPLDPELPIERLAYMIDDAAPCAVVTQQALRANLPALSVPVVETEALDWNARVGFDAVTGRTELPAYLIYTSGSTGKPKGVAVLQRGLVNCLQSIAREPGFSQNDVLVGVTTLSFDIAACDMFLPFMLGARLVLADRDTMRDGALLAALIEREGGTFLQCTPATWRLLLSANWQGAPRMLGVTTGEVIPRNLLQQLLPKLSQLWNLYGPTETTIWSTGFRILDPDAPILIGKPIANTLCYILDSGKSPLPQGVAGELWIGGDGVADGYLNRPELTAERFVPDPFARVAGARMYRTGDLVRWLDRGQIECLGRIDFQVKLRGYRIELGEIETELNHHPAVAEAVCDVREHGANDARLVAWVTGKPGAAIDPSELREHLRHTLPGYMVPQTFRELESLPRLPNGKLDRKSLPDPFVDTNVPVQSKAPLLTPAQQTLGAIWAEVLGTSDIGADDHFFDLGGHSLLAVETATRLHKTFGVKLPLRTLMMDPLSVIAEGLDSFAEAPAQKAGRLSRLKRWLGHLSNEPDPGRDEAHLADLRAVQFPLYASTGTVRRQLGVVIGLVLGFLMPRRRARLERGEHAGDRLGRPDRLIIAGLAWRHQRSGTLGELTGLHNWLWRSDQAMIVHAYSNSVRYQAEWTEKRSAIVAPLGEAIEEFAQRDEPIETLCEIGCGTGRVLADVAVRLPMLRTLIGLDLSPGQVEINRRQHGYNARLRFECADAMQWLPEHAGPRWAYFSCGGVLEYFSEEMLETLFTDIARRKAPALFAIVEPLPKDYDLARETKSRPYDRELSLGHNYPHWLERGGWRVRFQAEQLSNDVRWLLLVAEVRA
ncbi:MAG: amino acid adenylation domain-containing protein [Nitrococcus sp.]|nr:amino acid adenylation domain-containing protein [Nitrococcus sp.]